MAIHFDLPAAVERHFHRQFSDLNAKAKESFLLAMYREGRLSHHALSRALRLDRFQTEEFLQQCSAAEDRGGSGEAHLADARAIRAIRNFWTLTHA